MGGPHPEENRPVNTPTGRSAGARVHPPAPPLASHRLPTHNPPATVLTIVACLTTIRVEKVTRVSCSNPGARPAPVAHGPAPMNETDRHRRLLATLALIEGAAPANAAIMTSWLLAQPAGPHVAPHFAVAVDAALQRLSWYAAGPPATFLRETTAFLEGAGVHPAEQQRLQHLTAALDPSRLGTWLMLTAHGLDGGWHMAGRAPAAAPLATLAPGTHANRFRSWLQTHELTTLRRVRRALGDPTPSLELLIDLAPLGDYRAAALQQLFVQLDTPWFGSDFVALLREEGCHDCDLLIGFAPTGVARLGVATSSPTRRLSLLVGALMDPAVHEHLARTEAALDSGEPALLLFSRAGDAWDAEFHYLL